MADDISTIDIPSDKIIEWCLSRGKVPNDWLTEWKALQGKLKATLSNEQTALPLHIKTKMEETGLTYWSCVDGFNLLSSELMTSRGLTHISGLKNFFGKYTDVSLRALSTLIDSYKKNAIHVAEGGKLLNQFTQYDIPSLKKNIQTNEKQITDILIKIQSCQRNSKELRVKFADTLKNTYNLSLSDKVIATLTQSELKEKLKENSSRIFLYFNKIHRLIQAQKLQDIISYYQDFVTFTLTQGNNQLLAEVQSFIPKLDSIQQLLAMTAKTEEDDSQALKKLEEKHTAETTTGTTNAEPTIDLSLDGEGEGGGIDWSALMSVSGAGTDVNTNSTDDNTATTSINWDTDDTANDDALAQAMADLNNASSSSSSSSNNNSQLSTDSPCASLFLSEAFRHSFLTDLLELESFLTERLADLEQAEEVSQAAFTSSPNLPKSLTIQSPEKIKAFLSSIASVLSAMRDNHLQQQLSILSSDRYVDRCVENVFQLRFSAERQERTVIELEQRRNELQKQTQKAQKEFKDIQSKMKLIKKDLETEISKLIQGRKVIIMGEINQML